MTTPIFDSIINGVLSPTMIEQYSVPISRISQVLTRLPDRISQLESLLENQLGNYVRFDFAEEKAAPLFISGEVYHPIPNYKYDININAFPMPDDSPVKRFYTKIINAQSSYVKLALKEFSATAKADIDTKGEIKRTLEGLYHLSLQIKNVQDTEVIQYSLKQQIIRLYYEVAYTFSHILPEDKIESFEDYYYTLFSSYPQNDISELFNTEKLKATIQNCILSNDDNISLHKDLLKQSIAHEPLHSLSVWLANYIVTETFFIKSEADISTERGSHNLSRHIIEQKTKEYAKTSSKSELIAKIENDIESIADLCASLPTSAPSLTIAWLQAQLQSADAKPGSSSTDFSQRDGLVYKGLVTKVEQIKDLFDFLVHENKIDVSTEYTNFKKVFSGHYATAPIKWTGVFSELMAMFKQMKKDGVFVSNDKIWDKVSKSFIRKDGTPFTATQIASQHPSASHKLFAKRASDLLTA